MLCLSRIDHLQKNQMVLFFNFRLILLRTWKSGRKEFLMRASTTIRLVKVSLIKIILKINLYAYFIIQVKSLKKFRPILVSDHKKNGRCFQTGISKIFSDDVLFQYNWDGLRKKKLSDLKIFNDVLYGNFLNYYNIKFCFTKQHSFNSFLVLNIQKH